MKQPRSVRTAIVELVALLAASAALAAGPTLRITTNFTGSTYGTHSTAIVPDTDGAVGQRHEDPIRGFQVSISATPSTTTASKYSVAPSRFSRTCR